jgi:hypothetical protein
VEALYKKVHAAISADPSMAKSTKEPPKEHKRYKALLSCPVGFRSMIVFVI